jgi:F-type H+-transporting ATPase subunit gamma
MALGLSKTKRRIASIRGTEKITKAMELIATVKLKRVKNAEEALAPYSDEMAALLSELFAHDLATGSHYGKLNEGKDLGTLYLVITSDLGLCGGYNGAIYKYVDSLAKKGDTIAPIGQKGINHFARVSKDYAVSDEFSSLSLDCSLSLIHEACAALKDEFNAGKYKNICLVYTHYVNSLTFAPSAFQLLPVQLAHKKWANEEYCPPLFDASPREYIHLFMPSYLSANFYARMLESELSEQASRRTAMDNANDNADDLLSKLTVEYNKARQNAITQEITEVVSGSMGSN